MASRDAFAPASLGPVQLRNRFVKAATFEGMAVDNLVTDRLVDFHRAVAAGGVGMTTLAYLAVSPDGRGAPGEIVVRPDAVPGLARLAEAVHAEGAVAAAQIGHAGPVAAATGRRGLAPSRVFSPLAMKFTREATDRDIARVVGDFATAAGLLQQAGFDAIEVHLGHNYLPSAFLSPDLNRRTDAWGGDVEARSRFAREIVTAVREAVGTSTAVTAKLNMADGYRGGLWLEDSLQVGRLLESDGALDAIELTAGSSLKNPMYLFRGDAPVAEMAAAFPQPMRTAVRLVGGRFLKSYPYEEGYLLPFARQFRQALTMPLIALGGISRRETVALAIDEGFEFVAMARALLREPDLVRRWQEGDTADSLCIHCNKCMPTIYEGTHCVLVPPDQRPGARGT